MKFDIVPFWRKSVHNTRVSISKLRGRVEQEIKDPILAETYPKICRCGSGDFFLESYEDIQVQQCRKCKTKYRSSLAEAVSKGRCPDCSGQLYEGPSGGAAVNIYCDKGHRFWLGIPFGHAIVERLDVIPELRAQVLPPPSPTGNEKSQ